MSMNSLHEILVETTQELRKGEVVERSTVTAPVLVETAEGDPVGVGQRPVVEVIDVYVMPHVSKAEGRDDLEIVDVHFVHVAVSKAAAEANRDRLIEALCDYPEPDRLAGGPSYIEVGGVIGDQGAALRLFALGQVLGLWKVITPETLGFEGEQARKLAGNGMVMMSGWRAA